MLNIMKISLLMVLALAVLTACQESAKVTAPELAEPSLDGSLGIALTKGAVNGDPVDLPVWTNKAVEPGHIFVANDAANLYVSYYLNDNWQLAGANLNIVKTAGELPVDGQVLPLPEKFRYKATLNRCESVYTQVIPLAELGLNNGDDFMLVSQAMLGEIDPLDHLSQPYNICVPGNGDQQWWQIGRGRVKSDPNSPERRQQITLQGLTNDSRML
ncbi:MAG: hypothetical protein WCR92_04630 [Candidatus Cloacimonadaceae bacterium]